MFEKIWPWGSAPAPAALPAKPFDPTDPKQNPLNPDGVKPCCACPLTKRARDECFLKFGPDAEVKCADLLEQHLACMRGFGFKV